MIISLTLVSSKDYQVEWIGRDSLPNIESLALDFVVNNLSYQSVAIYTNYLTDDESIPAGQDILSESQGLWLLYLLNRDFKDVFEKSYLWTMNNLILGNDTIAWVKDKHTSIHRINASIDDLRIIRALVLAYEKWGQKQYLVRAKEIAGGLLRENVNLSFLTDFYDLDTHYRSNTMTLSYIDLCTIGMIASYDPEWAKIYDNCLEVIINGQINSTGLYAFQYEFASHKYITPAEVDMIQSVYVMLHLAEVDLLSKDNWEWLWNEYLNNGKLTVKYSRTTHEPLSRVESTALYALAARVFYYVDQKDKAEAMLRKCHELQVINEQSAIYGSFGYDTRLEVYSFDNLQYLYSSSLIMK